MTTAPQSILVVEDSPDHGELIRRGFGTRADSLPVTIATTLLEARRLLAASIPALVICDWHLPDGKAVELLPEDAETLPYPVLVMTSLGNEQMAVEALKAGAADYIVKSEKAFAAMPRIAERALREWEHRQARRRAETGLRVSEERFRSLSNCSPAGIFHTDGAGECHYTNRRWQEITGLTLEESLGHGWRRAVHPDDYAGLLAEWQVFVDGGQTFSHEFRVVRPSGEIRWVHSHAAPLVSSGRVIGFVGTDQDITEQRAAKETIEASLREKEAMLREIHHRVKNNLQVVSSLLNLQAAHLRDPDARAMFAETQGRVRSMALVHEKLYQSKDLSRVSFDEYVRTLVGDVCRSVGADQRPISILIDVSAVKLAIDTAIPCGLMINELVTNAVKHAFPDARAGEIRISLHLRDSGRLELIVEDNGVGLPRDLDPRQAVSLGLDLVFAFADQLGADVHVRRDQGTAFSFTFDGGT